METAFGHLKRLLRVYYTYMWSLVIAKDLFTEFKTDAMVDPKVAAKYRQTILAASERIGGGTWCVTSWAVHTHSRPMRDWLNGK